MLVEQLVEKLLKLPQKSQIIITSMDDTFSCSDFDVHSPVDETAQEIIMNVFLD